MKRGFTLIELLVVIAVIGMLASINSGGCGGAQFYSYTSDGSTYRLASVQEQDGFAGCDVACGTWWGGNTYQFCINQGM